MRDGIEVLGAFTAAVIFIGFIVLVLLVTNSYVIADGMWHCASFDQELNRCVTYELNSKFRSKK